MPHEHGDDPNDLLRADRDAFAGSVCDALRQAREVRDLAQKEGEELPGLQDVPSQADHSIPIDAEAALREAEEAERRKALQEIAQNSTGSNRLATFQAHVDAGFGDPISTGYKNIDTVFDGGFRPGLYIIGAGTGIGKTSLSLQIADNVARSRHPVLYVSMEMSCDELKSWYHSMSTMKY